MRVAVALTGAALGALLVASPSAASVVVVTFDGTIAGGDGAFGNAALDRLGLFGPVDANLLGDAYEATYTFDTTLGTVVSSACLPASAGCSTGKNTLAGPPGGIPAVSEALTINGHTFSFGGSTFPVNSAELQATNDGSGFPSGIFAEVEANADLNSLRDELDITDGAIPASLVGTYHYTIQPGDHATTGNSFFQADTSGGIDRFEFGISSVSLAAVSSAPEPASWALTLAGVALLGGALRRKSNLMAPRPSF